MSIPPEVGLGAVRFSLGRGTNAEEIDYVADLLRQRLQ
jgi:cysteine sulfinate desulfinase/cysteine desulfurase-like protein